MDNSWIKLPCNSLAYLAGFNTFLDFNILYEEVHGEKPRMKYDDHLPQSSQIGVQVDQYDLVNDSVLDAFGSQDDNFFTEVQCVDPVFLRNDAA
ncbi:hypothetical protein K1719_028123 [Acacia pycnantha]|nr:hypothetical protein K1719_028123 [Acacia pycnantha]